MLCLLYNIYNIKFIYVIYFHFWILFRLVYFYFKPQTVKVDISCPGYFDQVEFLPRE